MLCVPICKSTGSKESEKSHQTKCWRRCSPGGNVNGNNYSRNHMVEQMVHISHALAVTQEEKHLYLGTIKRQIQKSFSDKVTKYSNSCINLTTPHGNVCWETKMSLVSDFDRRLINHWDVFLQQNIIAHNCLETNVTGLETNVTGHVKDLVT